MWTLYGINNCDTIKKAKRTLSELGIDFTFHDYKKLGVPQDQLEHWLADQGMDVLLNKRGTTWRALDDDTKASINEHTVKALMLDNPSIIKRPVLTDGTRIIVGFDLATYQTLSC